MRRLPVYFLMDCSESMIGEAIEAVQEGVEMLLRELKKNPNALETAYISFITYHSHAKQIVPLTDLISIQLPKLQVQPGTSMGGAFTLLKECINREVKKTTKERKGDFRPIVFLLTDGQPTDNSTLLIQSIRGLVSPKIANIYSIGCGDDVDFDVLQQFSDAVFKLEDMKPENLNKLFVWLSASVQNASAGVNEGTNMDGIDLKKKPPEVEIILEKNNKTKDKTPKQVFLKAYCSKKKGAYLIRYKLNPQTKSYDPIKSHKLEETNTDSSVFESPKIDSSQLIGCQPCPYCSNDGIAVCSCGSILCYKCNQKDMRLTCPKCNKTDDYTFGRSFEITQSSG